MPLCPQIVITPITVTSANMTVTSVIAGGVSATYEQLSEVDIAAQQALADAQTAIADANQAIADANTAIANAAAANAAATAAAYQAGVAQTTADGKNKVNYSTSTPSGTGANGDLWFRVDAGTGAVLQQYTYNTSTSTWVERQLTNTVIANLDAGKITAGTITGIAYNNGSGTFSVSPAGVLVATSATITGAITATSGTFTGTVYASAGTFTGTVTATSGSFTGSLFSTNGTIGGWNINSTTISKNVGTKTMTLNSSNATITINDSGTGLYNSGALTISNASASTNYGVAGFVVGSDFAFDGMNELGGYTGIPRIYSSINRGIRIVPGAGLGDANYNVSVEGHLNAIYTLSTGTYTSSSTDLTTGTYISSSGAIISRRSNQIPFFANRHNTTGTSEFIRLVYNGSDGGGITTTAGGVPAFRNASDYRLKTDIQDFNGATEIIKATRLRSFKYNVEPDKTAIGFIAHELAEALPDLVLGQKDAIDEEGNPEYQSITTTNLIPYLTGAMKDLILRIEVLEQGR